MDKVARPSGFPSSENCMMVTLSLPDVSPANERVANAMVIPDRANKKCLRCMMHSSCALDLFKEQTLHPVRVSA
jgi:hypothetical protein